MAPKSIDRDRERLAHMLVAEHRRGWIPVAVLGAVGLLLVVSLASGLAGAGTSRTSATAIAILSIGAAAGLTYRQAQLGHVARRLIELIVRPDLIVWIYEHEPHIYVCSRRGERLRFVPPSARRVQVVALLARLVPDAPRGFSSARDAAFERDPLSVTSA